MVMLMLVTMPSQAQIKLGLRGGVNLSDVKFNKNDLKADNCVGFFAGPVVKLSLPLTGLSVDASALYDQQIEDVCHSGQPAIHRRHSDVVCVRFRWSSVRFQHQR